MATKPRFHRFSDLIRPFAIATISFLMATTADGSFSDLIRPFAIATLYSLPHMRVIIGFSDLIRPFAIATPRAKAMTESQPVSVTSYGHSLLQPPFIEGRVR